MDVSIRDVPYLTLTDSEQKNVEMKVDENVTVDQQEQQIFTGGLPMVPVGLRCRWATHVYNFVCEYECFSFSKNTAVNYYVMSLSDRC